MYQTCLVIIIGRPIPCDLGFFLEMWNFAIKDDLEISDNVVVVIVVWLLMLIVWTS